MRELRKAFQDGSSFRATVDPTLSDAGPHNLTDSAFRTLNLSNKGYRIIELITLVISFRRFVVFALHHMVSKSGFLITGRLFTV